MWLPDRPPQTVIDNWPPKSLPIYADFDYEVFRMTDPKEKTVDDAPEDDQPEPANAPVEEPPPPEDDPTTSPEG